MAAKISTKVDPRHDYMHPLGKEDNFNESMYFNFYDTGAGLGGWLRAGNRANEGYAEISVCLYLPDGRVGFMFQRPEIGGNDAFDAGGLRLEVLEAGRRLRSVYEGPVLELREPQQMSNPRAAFKNNPMATVRLDLEHSAVGPMYGDTGNEGESSAPPEQQFAAAHYEQHMRVRGSLAFNDETWTIDGFGLRDHSWGPCYWQAIHRYEWLTMNFGEDFGAMVSVIQRDEAGENLSVGGVIVRGDTVEEIVKAEITAEYQDNGLYHEALRARVETAGGLNLEIEGRVKSFIPLRNRRAGKVTYIGEGLTEWLCEGRRGYGLSEFLRQTG